MVSADGKELVLGVALIAETLVMTTLLAGTFMALAIPAFRTSNPAGVFAVVTFTF